MHERVTKFVDDLHANPPADLAEWLNADSARRALHRQEFDLEAPANPHRVEDAEKILPELIRRAEEGRTMTFTEFCQFVGRGNPRTTGGQSLNPIVAMCLSEDDLPPLWTLIVLAGTGLGSGYWLEHNDEQKVARQEECFARYNVRRAEALPSARTARRQPTVVIRETCPECYMERTPSGTCGC